MSTVFEDIVPSFELCKKIPGGKFHDSIFVWASELSYDPGHHSPAIALPRCVAIDDQIIAPAPTLMEIMIEIDHTPGWNCSEVTYAANSFITRLIGINLYKVSCNGNPATALLELWLTFIGEKNANIY